MFFCASQDNFHPLPDLIDFHKLSFAGGKILRSTTAVFSFFDKFDKA
jgi:hypothetical protein